VFLAISPLLSQLFPIPSPLSPLLSPLSRRKPVV
jgi:hypothetical protein